MPKRKRIQNLPIHTFQSFSDEADNFNITSFSARGLVSEPPLPHRHAYYEIIYIKRGQGAHLIDFETYPIVPGSLHLFTPEQIHLWQITQPVEGIRIKFSENFLLLPPAELYLAEYFDFIHNPESPPHLVLKEGQGDEIKDLFGRIEKEYHSSDYARDLKTRSYLIILLIEIQRLHMAGSGQKDAIRGSALVSRFKKMVAKGFLTHRSTAYYAGQLGISEAYLHELTKENTGLTPGQIIRREIAMEAKRLLAHTAGAMSQIGYQLGFEDPSYFGRFFKRETGLSPKAFRAHILEKYQTFPV